MVAMVVGGRDWRYWLVEIPARITDVGMTWYRLYMMVLLLIAPALLIGVIVLLVMAALGFDVGK